MSSQSQFLRNITKIYMIKLAIVALAMVIVRGVNRGEPTVSQHARGIPERAKRQQKLSLLTQSRYAAARCKIAGVRASRAVSKENSTCS